MVRYPKKQRIAVVINTLNSERIFDKCLQGVAWADEIIVCDMYSSDKTVEIAHKYGAKVYFYQKSDGSLADARNFAASKVTSDWTLVIDSDEVISDDLQDYLIKFMHIADDSVVGLEIPRETFALGQKIKCMYEQGLLRFWRTGACSWQGEVYSHPQLLQEGRILSIDNKHSNLIISHYYINSIESYLLKVNKNTSLVTSNLLSKKFKVGYLRLILAPFFVFFEYFILKGGLFDGMAGFIVCIMQAQLEFIKQAKLYELHFKENNPNLIY